MDIISIVLASTLACSSTANTELVGLWESASTSRGGIGNNIEFRADGSFVSAITVLVDLRYEVKDGKLYTGKNRGEPVSYEEGDRINIKPDALVSIGPNGEQLVRKRLRPDRGNSIVGQYKYRHYTGGMAYEQYGSDGIMRIRIPMTSSRGCYRLDRGTVSIRALQGEPRSLKYKLQADRLALEDQGRPMNYNHVKEGPWYDSEKIDYVEPKK